MNVIAEIQRINEEELQKGYVNTSASWHSKYSQSAWCFIGNLSSELTEGDVICVMSQFGEVEDINLVRDNETGKSRGFAFVKYEDARSCVLAVDNFTGTKILERHIRVDHVEKYRLPKHLLEKEENESKTKKDKNYYGPESETSAKMLSAPGHAYDGQEFENSFDVNKGQDLFDSTAESNHDRNDSVKGREKEAKRQRKEERAQKRREKEERKEKREERRREKRAREMRKSDGEKISHNVEHDSQEGYNKKRDKRQHHR